jgi:hypothetical protein
MGPERIGLLLVTGEGNRETIYVIDHGMCVEITGKNFHQDVEAADFQSELCVPGTEKATDLLILDVVSGDPAVFPIYSPMTKRW